MRFGLDVSPPRDWGGPRRLAGLAALAERSGGDGVFLEDDVSYPGELPAYEPWIALAAIALTTERLQEIPVEEALEPTEEVQPRAGAPEAVALGRVGEVLERLAQAPQLGDDLLRLPRIDALVALAVRDEQRRLDVLEAVDR